MGETDDKVDFLIEQFFVAHNRANELKAKLEGLDGIYQKVDLALTFVNYGEEFKELYAIRNDIFDQKKDVLNKHDTEAIIAFNMAKKLVDDHSGMVEGYRYASIVLNRLVSKPCQPTGLKEKDEAWQ